MDLHSVNPQVDQEDFGVQKFWDVIFGLMRMGFGNRLWVLKKLGFVLVRHLLHIGVEFLQAGRTTETKTDSLSFFWGMV